MLDQELNKYLSWCKKYELKPQDYKNFYLYTIKSDMFMWFDEILPAIENGSITGNLANALLGN